MPSLHSSGRGRYAIRRAASREKSGAAGKSPVSSIVTGSVPSGSHRKGVAHAPASAELASPPPSGAASRSASGRGAGVPPPLAPPPPADPSSASPPPPPTGGRGALPAPEHPRTKTSATHRNDI